MSFLFYFIFFLHTFPASDGKISDIRRWKFVTALNLQLGSVQEMPGQNAFYSFPIRFNSGAGLMIRPAALYGFHMVWGECLSVIPAARLLLLPSDPKAFGVTGWWYNHQDTWMAVVEQESHAEAIACLWRSIGALTDRGWDVSEWFLSSLAHSMQAGPWKVRSKETTKIRWAQIRALMKNSALLI